MDVLKNMSDYSGNMECQVVTVLVAANDGNKIQVKFQFSLLRNKQS